MKDSLKHLAWVIGAIGAVLAWYGMDKLTAVLPSGGGRTIIAFDVEKKRDRLRKLSDEELVREGKAGRYMCSANVNFRKPPRDEFVIDLRLCKEEWRRRRHPNTRNEANS
jgi:hypothetical protein